MAALSVPLQVNDTYSVLLKQKNLPLALLGDSLAQGEGTAKARRAHLLGVQPFSNTFGKKKNRKKPNISAEDYASLVQEVRARVYAVYIDAAATNCM